MQQAAQALANATQLARLRAAERKCKPAHIEMHLNPAGPAAAGRRCDHTLVCVVLYLSIRSTPLALHVHVVGTNPRSLRSPVHPLIYGLAFFGG